MDKTSKANLPGAQRGSERTRIGIEGMTCDHCAQRVERALRGLEGVGEVSVDRAAAVAEVTFDRSKVDVPAMHEALLTSGYKPVPAA